MKQDLDGKEALLRDRETLRRKGFLNKLYGDFYEELKPTDVPSGPIIELGSGAGFIKDVIPGVITSDVIKAPGIDKVFFAEKIPYENSSVSAFVMIDVLHHIKDPKKGFKEMQRCLKKGGKIIMIEPWNSVWGSFIFKFLHHENFNPKAGWKLKGKGRMSDSNSALPWIIFVRDRKVFEKKFPSLEIVKLEPHTPFSYLASGGLTKFQFLPTFGYGALRATEEILSPLSYLLGMFITIELQKR